MSDLDHGTGDGDDLDCEETGSDEGCWCTSCDGTGIGQGDPDTSRCARCHGLGIIKPEPEYDGPEYDDGPEYSSGDWGQPGDGRYL